MPRPSDKVQAFGNDAGSGSAEGVAVRRRGVEDCLGTDPCIRRGREPLALAATKLQCPRFEQSLCYPQLPRRTQPRTKPCDLDHVHSSPTGFYALAHIHQHLYRNTQPNRDIYFIRDLRYHYRASEHSLHFQNLW